MAKFILILFVLLGLSVQSAVLAYTVTTVEPLPNYYQNYSQSYPQNSSQQDVQSYLQSQNANQNNYQAQYPNPYANPYVNPYTNQYQSPYQTGYQYPYRLNNGYAQQSINQVPYSIVNSTLGATTGNVKQQILRSVGKRALYSLMGGY